RRETPVAGHPEMLAVGPHCLSPSVELPSLRDKITVGLLPAREKLEALAGDVMIAGEIVHADDIGRVAQPECLVLKVGHFLDIEAIDLVPRDKVIDQACPEGIVDFFFRHCYIDAEVDCFLPQIRRSPEIPVE